MESQLEHIIEILKRVPEKKLLIIELANSVPRKYGDFDPDALREILPQVQLAKAEAESYSQHTLEAIQALANMPDRDENYRLEPLDELVLEAGLQF